MSEQMQSSVPAEPVGEIQWEAPVESAPEAPAAPESAPVEPTAPAETPQEPSAPEVEPDFSHSALENGQHEIRLATGQVYRGATEGEAWGKVAQAQIEASRTIQQLRQQAAPPTPLVPQQSAAPQIDPATQALLDMIAPGLGLTNGQELADSLKAMRTQQAHYAEVIQGQQEARIAQEFVSKHPDFIPTPANAAKIDEVMTRMGLPMTLDGLQLAHYAIKGQGLYETPAPRTPTGQFAARNTMPLPPNGTAPAPTGQPQVDPWSMSDDAFNEAFASRMQ